MTILTKILSACLCALILFHGIFYILYHPPTSVSTASATSATGAASVEVTSTWQLDTACDDGNPCTRDLGRVVAGMRTCWHPPAPLTQRCVHGAYRNGSFLYCDRGACVGEPGDCLGSGCATDADCDNLFALRSDINRTLIGDFELRPVDTTTRCAHGECSFHVLVAALTSVKQSDEWWSARTGPHLAQGQVTCGAFLQTRRRQLASHFELLDTRLTDYFDPAVALWGLPAYPVQLGMCHYRLPCAKGYGASSAPRTPSPAPAASGTPSSVNAPSPSGPIEATTPSPS